MCEFLWCLLTPWSIFKPSMQLFTARVHLNSQQRVQTGPNPVLAAVRALSVTRGSVSISVRRTVAGPHSSAMVRSSNMSTCTRGRWSCWTRLVGSAARALRVQDRSAHQLGASRWEREGGELPSPKDSLSAHRRIRDPEIPRFGISRSRRAMFGGVWEFIPMCPGRILFVRRGRTCVKYSQIERPPQSAPARLGPTHTTARHGSVEP